VASQWPSNPDDVLRGMFGSITSAAEFGGRGAANMWNAVKDAAASWAEGVLNVTSATPPSALEIQDMAHNLIGGVTIQDMNRYVKEAGSFIAAKTSLQNLSATDQITGQQIFTPSWNVTGDNPAIPTRYRINVLRDITVHGFTAIERTEWASYELTGPLTTIEDALNQANNLFQAADYNSRADIKNVLDYSIETI